MKGGYNTLKQPLFYVLCCILEINTQAFRLFYWFYGLSSVAECIKWIPVSFINESLGATSLVRSSSKKSFTMFYRQMCIQWLRKLKFICLLGPANIFSLNST